MNLETLLSAANYLHISPAAWLTGDRKHLYQAQKFADFMQTEEFQQAARQPNCPLSLYEGWAGTMCYLVNLMNHESPDGQFPFFENCLQ